MALNEKCDGMEQVSKFHLNFFPVINETFDMRNCAFLSVERKSIEFVNSGNSIPILVGITGILG